MDTKLSEIIANARKYTRDISAEDLNDKIDSGDDILIIDIREPYEYEIAHIPNAFLVPRGLIESAADPNNRRRVEILCQARNKTVVLYCDTGGRSTLAANTLQMMGFRHVFNLAGGLKLWDAEDLPLDSGEYKLPLP